jgi:fatty-acyl-CoA synthase
VRPVYRQELTPTNFLWGEVPKPFVTLKPGASAGADENIEHVRAGIAHYKAPRVVEFGGLPTTSTGKIQKYVLR